MTTAYRLQRTGKDDPDSRSTPGASGTSQGLYDRLVRVVRRRSREQDPRDVVQDAFLRLSLEKTRTEVRDPAAFLHVAVFNLVRDRARSAATRETVAGEVADIDAVPADVPSPERALDGKRRLAMLEEALNELPPKVRAALILYRFDEMPQARIAEQLGLSVSMVEKHIRRALQHCKRRLAEADRDA